MVTSYLVLLVVTTLLAITVNYFRFTFRMNINKILLATASLLLYELHGYFIGYEQNGAIILFIILTTFCFQVYGGIVAGVVSWVLYTFHTNDISIYLLLGYVLLGIGSGLLTKYFLQLRVEREQLKSMLIKNSKQLNVYREVSTSMQQTHELDKILQIIVTSVTAGHGLGFNRAMIFLTNDDATKLQGIMGVGPLSPEEGFKTWERITKNKLRLVDLIQIQGEEKGLDPQLNEIVRALKIDLTDHNFFHQTLEDGKPHHITNINQDDAAQVLLSRQFGMNEFVACPLINQGIKVGVLLIDNPVNKRKITPDDIDSVIPMANQAAIAIQQSHLYTQVEDMALKDGLTGLLNQRAFQSFLKQYLPTTSLDPLSLILLDIDFFKHFNDTNGHLLGNDVLIQLGGIINGSIRETDHAFRFGGEEFVVLLPGTSAMEASSIAERIRANVASANFPCGEKQPTGRLTISVGVSSSENLDDLTGSSLVDAADKVLYEAKALGKNKVVTYKG